MMKRRLSEPSIDSGLVTQAAGIRRSGTDRATVKRLMLLLKAGADTRLKKVKRIRQSVRTRSYENDLKLTVAVDRMSQDLQL